MSAVTTVYTVTATGVQAPLAAPGSTPFATYGLQVKGTGSAATAWSVTLDGSLDGVNWTTIITHNATDGSTSWDATGSPCNFIRINTGSLTLSPATALVVSVVAVP